VTDIFFSYRSVDRERVRPIRDAFAGQGFEVFWDQEVPTGADWDTWIRQHLGKSKCAVIFWSTASVASDNVRHEATIAKLQGKLIAVLLEHLSPDQFPMGLYSQQAVNLADWRGDLDHEGWRKLNRDIEAMLTPPWVERKIFELEAELIAERARRERAQNRVRALEAQIAKEVQAQEDLKRERDKAVDTVAALQQTLRQSTLAQSAAEQRAADLSKRLVEAETRAQEDLKRERDKTADAVAALQQTLHQSTLKQSETEQRLSDLSRRLTEVQGEARTWPASAISPESGPARESASGVVRFAGDRRALLVAVAGFFVAFVFWINWDTRPNLSKSSPSPPAVPPQAQSAPTTPPVAQPSPANMSGLFTIMSNTEAYGGSIPTYISVRSIEECEQSCRRSAACNTFAYSKISKSCFSYSDAKLRPNTSFDSGVRR
jgi:hypothetical protein